MLYSAGPIRVLSRELGARKKAATMSTQHCSLGSIKTNAETCQERGSLHHVLSVREKHGDRGTIDFNEGKPCCRFQIKRAGSI